MSLFVTPYKNHFKPGEERFFARTHGSGHVSFDKLVETMAQGRTLITAPDIAAILILFKETVARLVADGKTVHTPMGSFYLCATGRLESEDQAFTPGQSEHAVTLHFRTAKDYADELTATVDIERAERTDRLAPVIRTVSCPDRAAEEPVKAGDYLCIEGKRIKFDKANQAEGIFFINGSTHRAAQYAMVSPRMVMAKIPPDLEPGSYAVAVRTMPTGKETKEGRLKSELAVS